MDLPGEAFGPLFLWALPGLIAYLGASLNAVLFMGEASWTKSPLQTLPPGLLTGLPPLLTLAICLARSDGGKEIVLPVPPKTQDLVKTPTPGCLLLTHNMVLLFSTCYAFSTFIYLLLLLFSRQVVSDSLRPHGLQHSRFPCPSPFPGVCSNSCPLSQWYHPTISSSVTPFTYFFWLCGVFIELHRLFAAACGLL